MLTLPAWIFTFLYLHPLLSLSSLKAIKHPVILVKQFKDEAKDSMYPRPRH